MRYSPASICLLWFVLILASITSGRGAQSIELPGQRTDGSVLLPNQWSLRPLGRQIPLGDFPLNMAVHPGNRWTAVLHCGYGKQELVIVDLSMNEIVSREPLDEAFYGVEFSRDGSKIFCSG